MNPRAGDGVIRACGPRRASAAPPDAGPNTPLLPRLLRAAAEMLILASIAYAPPAGADTIYLSSGRVIHTGAVRIEGERVIFRQFGGEVSIPRSAVVRIIEDDTVERSVAPAGSNEAGGDSAPEAASRDATETPAPDVPASRAAPEHPSRRAEYWTKRIRAADERIARVQAELDRLPDYDEVDRRLLRFSGQALYFIAERDKWEEMLRRFQRTRRQLLEGARKAGITPGALRAGLDR